MSPTAVPRTLATMAEKISTMRLIWDRLMTWEKMAAPSSLSPSRCWALGGLSGQETFGTQLLVSATRSIGPYGASHCAKTAMPMKNTRIASPTMAVRLCRIRVHTSCIRRRATRREAWNGEITPGRITASVVPTLSPHETLIRGSSKSIRASRPKVGRPGDARRSSACPLGAVRGGHLGPFRLVPVVDDVQGTEDPVHVQRPGNVPARRADREAPGRAEFVIDFSRGAVLRRNRVNGPGGIIDRVPAVVLEGMGEDLRSVRLQAHRIHIDGRGKREEGSHPKRGDRPAVAAGGASVRGRRGPAVRAGTGVVVVPPVQVDLQ